MISVTVLFRVNERMMSNSGFFFFFKQKTAYEIGVRLVGSEMCIRDRTTGVSKWKIIWEEIFLSL